MKTINQKAEEYRDIINILKKGYSIRVTAKVDREKHQLRATSEERLSVVTFVKVLPMCRV